MYVACTYVLRCVFWPQVYTISEAIDFVNSKNKPLALYLFTNDKDLKTRVTKETSTGNVVINDTVVQVRLHFCSPHSKSERKLLICANNSVH